MKKGFILLFLSISLFLGSCTKDPDVNRLKEDLIGKHCDLGGTRYWTFSSLSEYENFTIVNKKSEGNILEYTADLVLKDRGVTYNLTANIVYRKESGKWNFISIERKKN